MTDTIPDMRQHMLFMAALCGIALGACRDAASPSTVPAAAALGAPQLVALAPDNELVFFAPGSPQDIRSLRLQGVDDPVVGVGVRPLDGRLYGVTTKDQLLQIDIGSGAVTPVSALGSAFGGDEATAFSFNPQADRLRLVGTRGQNLRIQVELGAVAVDGDLHYAADDVHAGRAPQIVAVGYTNSFADAPTTVMFDIDAHSDTLVLQDPPNDGVLRTVGPLGVDCDAATGFEIGFVQPGDERAFLVCGRTLYRVDLETGAASVIGEIGGTAPRFLALALLHGSGGG